MSRFENIKEKQSIQLCFFAGMGIWERITAMNTRIHPRVSQNVRVSLRSSQPKITANTDSRLMIKEAGVDSSFCCPRIKRERR